MRLAPHSVIAVCPLPREELAPFPMSEFSLLMFSSAMWYL